MRQAPLVSDLHRAGPDPASRRIILLGVVLSLLAHLLLVYLLQEEPWFRFKTQKPPPLEITMVIPPPPPPPPPPPVQAEPPTPPPPPPLLQAAPLAEKSVAPPAAQPQRREAAPRPRPEEAPKTADPGPRPKPLPRPTPQAPAAAPLSPSEMANAVQNAPEMAQSEQDYFLQQILGYWIIDLDAPQFAHIVISGSYVVLPDGMLAPPFGKGDPFDMNVMVQNWQMLARARGMQAERTAMETFLRAMRLAQPMKLPPNFGQQPKRMTLDFRVGDLP